VGGHGLSALDDLTAKLASIYVPPHASVSPLGKPEAVSGYWRAGTVAHQIEAVAGLYRHFGFNSGYIEPSELTKHAHLIGIPEGELLRRLRPYGIELRTSSTMGNVSVGYQTTGMGGGGEGLSRQEGSALEKVAAGTKVTVPAHWSETADGHPLWINEIERDAVKLSQEEKDALDGLNTEPPPIDLDVGQRQEIVDALHSKVEEIAQRTGESGQVRLAYGEIAYGDVAGTETDLQDYPGDLGPAIHPCPIESIMAGDQLLGDDGRVDQVMRDPEPQDEDSFVLTVQYADAGPDSDQLRQYLVPAGDEVAKVCDQADHPPEADYPAEDSSPDSGYGFSANVAKLAHIYVPPHPSTSRTGKPIQVSGYFMDRQGGMIGRALSSPARATRDLPDGTKLRVRPGDGGEGFHLDIRKPTSDTFEHVSTHANPEDAFAALRAYTAPKKGFLRKLLQPDVNPSLRRRSEMTTKQAKIAQLKRG
jgi:hypothetical protein